MDDRKHDHILFFVSIHIRHCWRMNSLVAEKLCLIHSVSIHIRHCWRMNLPLRRRQTPGLSVVSIHIRHCWRMNWRGSQTGEKLQRVSIHIRHCWRMNCSCLCPCGPCAAGFNPHSPLLANELLHLADSFLQLLQFQSTFAIAGE